jgi:hypothetical protein
MAETQQTTEIPPLQETPIVIHITPDITHYKDNLKLLGYIYQEKLLETLRGKVPEKDLQRIDKICEQLIKKLL